MRRSRLMMAAAALAVGLMGNAAQAGYSVIWQPPGGSTTATTVLTGTLGSATVNGTTSVGGQNYGWTYNSDIGISVGAGTAPAVTAIGGIDPSATVIGLPNPGPATQSFTSTEALVNPILFFNYLDPGDVLDFTGLTINILSSNNVNISGNVVTGAAGASNTANDGFAVELVGSYTAFSFTAAANSNDGNFNGHTNGFTIGVRNAIPEPATVLSSLMGASLVGLVGLRRRKAQA